MVEVAELPAATEPGDKVPAVREYPDVGGTVIGVLPPPPQAVSQSDNAEAESRIAKFRAAFRFIATVSSVRWQVRPLCVNTVSRTSTRRNGKYYGNVACLERRTDAALLINDRRAFPNLGDKRLVFERRQINLDVGQSAGDGRAGQCERGR